jgi:hypothetical protein
MTPPFTLTLDRYGGFAGIPTRATLDSTDLRADEAAQLWTLANRAAEEAARRSTASPLAVPDSFTYRLTVVSGDDRHEYAFTQSAPGSSLRRLVEHLEPHLSM